MPPTTMPPTRPGFYWARIGGDLPRPIHVTGSAPDALYARIGGRYHDLSEVTSWTGHRQVKWDPEPFYPPAHMLPNDIPRPRSHPGEPMTTLDPKDPKFGLTDEEKRMAASYRQRLQEHPYTRSREARVRDLCGSSRWREVWLGFARAALTGRADPTSSRAAELADDMLLEAAERMGELA